MALMLNFFKVFAKKIPNLKITEFNIVCLIVKNVIEKEVMIAADPNGMESSIKNIRQFSVIFDPLPVSTAVLI